MKTITEELLSRIGDARNLVVNVLVKEGYDMIHIKGSVSIPRNELEKGGWERLDRTREIVVHCSRY